jgi:perosamine synthetase
MNTTFSEIVEFIRTLFNQPVSMIPLHAPVFNGNEKKYLEDCVNSTFVSSVGKYVDKFEVEIEKYTGAKKAVACVNGTSALHLALKLVGVDTGDEVITQPLTFIATANAIAYCGAHPVFLDVDMDTMGLSPSSLEVWLKQNVKFKKLNKHNYNNNTPGIKPFNKVTGNPIAACVPMHTFGHPCRIDKIIDICQQYNIPVVEDAAESLGSFYKNRHTGTFGRIGILSFNGNKIITTGGGGMLLFQDQTLAERAKHLTTQAKTPHPWEFVHDEIGFNYRMPNINAAIGLAQLEQLPKFLSSKRHTAIKYHEFFTGIDIGIKKEPPNSSANYWLNCILLKNIKERNAFLRFTNNNGVMTRPAWKLMNELPMFKLCLKDKLENSAELADRLVNLPSSFK